MRRQRRRRFYSVGEKCLGTSPKCWETSKTCDYLTLEKVPLNVLVVMMTMAGEKFSWETAMLASLASTLIY